MGRGGSARNWPSPMGPVRWVSFSNPPHEAPMVRSNRHPDVRGGRPWGAPRPAPPPAPCGSSDRPPLLRVHEPRFLASADPENEWRSCASCATVAQPVAERSGGRLSAPGNPGSPSPCSHARRPPHRPADRPARSCRRSIVGPVASAGGGVARGPVATAATVAAGGVCLQDPPARVIFPCYHVQALFFLCSIALTARSFAKPLSLNLFI